MTNPSLIPVKKKVEKIPELRDENYEPEVSKKDKIRKTSKRPTKKKKKLDEELFKEMNQ